MTLPHAAQAQSSVTLYGIVDDSLNWSSNQGGGKKAYVANGLAGPRFGFLGVEELGGGMATFFQLEQGFSDTGTANSSTDMFQRVAKVGLRDRHWGAVSLGRQYSAYYSFVGPLSASGQVDGTQLAQPGDINGLDTTMRLNQSINYVSPAYGPWQIGMTYGFGGTPGHLGAGNAYSAAIGYAAGNLKLAGGYLRMNNGRAANGAWSSNASGSFLTTAINAGFQSARSVEVFGAGATYRLPHLVLGVTASSTRYHGGSGTLFAGTQHFDAIGTTFNYAIYPSITLAGGYNFVLSHGSQGAQTVARYHEAALAELYHLSKSVTVYLGQAYVHASGDTLGTEGSSAILAATAEIGDGSATTSSSGRSQFLGFAGMQYKF